MGVVVHHLAAMPVAAVIEAPARGLQAGDRLAQIGETHRLQPTGGDGSRRIAEVVATGQGQLDLANQLAVLVPVGQGAVPLFPAGDRREGHRLGAGDRPPVIGLELVPQHRAVAVGQ